MKKYQQEYNTPYQLKFPIEIEKIIETCMKRHRVIENPTIEDVLYADKITREEASLLVKEMNVK